MSESFPLIKSIRSSAGFRLSILFGSFFILLLLTSVLSILINQVDVGSGRTRMLISSSLQNILAFCLPALIAARFITDRPLQWLCLKTLPTVRSLSGVIIIYLVSMPAMEWLIEWNSNLHLPSALSEVETLFRQWEETGEEYTKLLLEANGIVPVISGVLVIGVLTGFSEELFFRGALLRILKNSALSRGIAVWTTAVIFSTLHFQFFGFVPRLLMGAFFGYLLLWTRSIWVPAFAHILNNSAVVISSALTGSAATSIKEAEQVSFIFDNSIIVICSVIFTALLLSFGRNYIFKTGQTDNLSWQKNQLPPAIEK